MPIPCSSAAICQASNLQWTPGDGRIGWGIVTDFSSLQALSRRGGRGPAARSLRASS